MGYRSGIAHLASATKRLPAPARIFLWALAAIVFAVAALPMLAALAQPGISTSDQFTEDFNDGHLTNPDRLTTVQGFKAGDKGWYLDPGVSGQLVYRVPGRPGTTIGVNLWVYPPPSGTSSISVHAEGQPTVVLASNVRYLGDRLVLPPSYASAPSVDIDIQAHNSSSAEFLVIDKLVSYAVHGTDPRAPPLYTFLAFGGLVGMVTFAGVRRRPNAGAVAVGLGVVATIAAASRISALFVLNLPLDPDAVGYRTFADRFQWWPLFDNGIFSANFAEREPLYPMVVHAYFQVLGSSDFHLRVVSTTLSIAVVILAVVAARRRLQTWWAPILVGFVVAISGPLVQESYRGLRLELETVLVLILYLALDRRPAKRWPLDAALVGLIGAAMVLARTYFIPVFLAAIALSFLLRYRPLPRAIGLIAVATLIMGGAAAAHRAGMYERHHDFSWDTGRYVRWAANIERFAYHRPLAHPELFPTADQYQSLGPYTGPDISSTQYFLVIHSPVELPRDSLAGSRQIFDSMDSFIFDVRAAVQVHRFPASLGPLAKSIALRFDLALRWIVLLGLMGMVLRAWRDPQLGLIPVIVVSWVGVNAFLFDHKILEQYRHTWQTYPLVIVAGVWLLESAAVVVSRRLPWRRFLNLNAWLFTVCVVLTLAQAFLPRAPRLVDAVLMAVAVGMLAYLRPALGVAAALVVISIGAGLGGSAAAAAALAGIVGRQRPSPRIIGPLLLMLPLALAALLAGGKPPSSTYVVADMVLVTSIVMVVVRETAARNQLLWMLAGMGPLAGIAYFVTASGPTAAALAPVGVVAAGWLYAHGHRWALVLLLLDLAVVVLVEPFAAWIGVAIAVAWVLVQLGQVGSKRRRLIFGAGLAVGLAALAAGASLAATTPSPDAAWSTRLTTDNASLEQQITADRTGDTSLWIYGRRASAFTDYPFRVEVNGSSITDDLNSYLPTEPLAWTRIPLPASPRVGDTLDVRITATGLPNATDRFIEIGGVYATAPGLVSHGVNGTYLIVLGDDSLPLAPGGLPEPMVRDTLQPPMGELMPGELDAPTAARKEASALGIWSQTLTTASQHPLGLGTGSLSATLVASGVGLGPGLSARNEYLQAAAEWGLPGLAGLLIVLAAAAWFALRARDRLAVALLLLTVVTMAGESLLLDSAGAASVWLVIGLCFGASSFGVNLQRAGNLTHDRDRAQD